MAKPVSFSKPKKTKSNVNTDFNFGFNVLSKAAAKKYNHKLGKSGYQAGGGS